jgi:formylglycine-generating enzyme required for sulfatase activity
LVAGLAFEVAVVCGGPACSQTAEARAQLVIVIDTDAHVVGELTPASVAGAGVDGSSPRISPDATIDTLRIDVLDDHNQLVDLRTFVVADPTSWPLSFGIEPSGRLGGEVRVWVRAFRALFATSSHASNGATTLEPPPQVAIDRLVAIQVPASGVERARITLRSDCIGTKSSFGSPLLTCLGAGHLAEEAHSGIDTSGNDAPSIVGTWRPALETQCKSAPVDGRVCIPGGYFILGDLEAVGAAETTEEEPSPLRPVVMSPFLLDKFELTVQDVRTLVNDGKLKGALPDPMTPGDPQKQFCSWLGASDSSHDRLPINCVSYATASELCKLRGGALPTEAQWEYAARGRGERRRYPWGDADPQCCSASLNRTGPPPVLPMMCPGAGLEPVGSHPASPGCTATGLAGTITQVGDVTLDGVEDMAGSLMEPLGDLLQPYDSPCWTGAGLLTNPSCQGVSNAANAMRGSYWNAGVATALLALRNSASMNGFPAQGVRCAYQDSP